MAKKRRSTKRKAKASAPARPKKPNPATAPRKRPKKTKAPAASERDHVHQKRLDAQILKALEKSRGLVARAARALKMTPRAIYYRLEQNPALAEALNDIREVRLDDAEFELSKAIDRGEAWAVCFYLKTIGRKRGFIERQEVGVAGALQVGGAVGIQKLLGELEQNDDFLESVRSGGAGLVAGLLCNAGRPTGPGPDPGAGNGYVPGGFPAEMDPGETPGNDRSGHNGSDAGKNGRKNPGN